MRLSATTIERYTKGLQYPKVSIKQPNPTNPYSYHQIQVMDVCQSIGAYPKVPFRQPEGWGERGVLRKVIPSPH